MNGDPASVIVHAEYESFYDRVVQPEHVIGVPRYFLRHIPFLGADLAWMYLAFRQAAYEVGLRKYGGAGRFSGRQIASWSGIVPRTFWNRAAKAETWEKLAGLVRPLRDAEVRWQEDVDALLQEPNQYAVSMTLPLGALDAASLRNWLALMVGKHDLELTLKLAAETPPEELFSDPDAEQDGPKTVFTLVHELFGEELAASRLTSLTTRLHRHIMGERLEITHFFARNVLPFLGTGPGLLWVLLRERADGKEQVTVEGGYAEMTAWLGLKDPETIWTWLNAKVTETRQKSRKASSGKTRTGGREASPLGTLRNPIMPLYVREILQGRADQDFAHAPRTFDVLQEEIPLELMHFPEHLDLEELEGWLVEHELFRRFAHPVPAVCTPLFLRFAHLIPAVCTVLNIQLTPPHSFAAAKEKSETEPEEPVLPYPTSLSEALAHPDIRFYQSMTGCYPELKDWVLAIDYIGQLRRLNPGLDETSLAQAGAQYFTEWEARGYQKTNPSWMHWWLSGYIPPRKARRADQKRTQAARPAPTPAQAESNPTRTPEEQERISAAIEESRRFLEEKGLLKPRID